MMTCRGFALACGCFCSCEKVRAENGVDLCLCFVYIYSLLIDGGNGGVAICVASLITAAMKWATSSTSSN